MQKKSLETILYSTLGVLVMLVVLVLANFILSFVRQRADMTQEKAYTLSDGTKAILKKLDTPVTIRFYCTQSESATPETVYLKGYARKVEDLLAEYKQIAGGKLKIEKYDPQPDSDAEDSARVDGLEPQALPGADRFYLGLSVKCAGGPEPRTAARIRSHPGHRARRGPGKADDRRDEPADAVRHARQPDDAADGPARFSALGPHQRAQE
jgi:ABC-type uncharacterized transport system